MHEERFGEFAENRTLVPNRSALGAKLSRPSEIRRQFPMGRCERGERIGKLVAIRV